MNIINIINKKRNKETLTKEEIDFVIEEYMANKIKDYQMSALLMAITINKLSLEETINLTDAMIRSGDRIDFEDLDVIDKHSTGGVGDKTTLIVGPIVASLGVNVAKMSGRGLGHTGGTIDKLESIPGFKTELTEKKFKDQIKDIGIAITSQTGSIAKADKKIYALRDVTGTVESISLIASSIMSKKIASGSSKIVIDVKVGNGALMKTEEDARKLANLMIEIGKHYNVKVVCVLTNMDEPLGQAIGNALEVGESIDVLNGEGASDITELACKLSAIMVGLDKGVSAPEAIEMIKEVISNKKALDKFKELVEKQGGDLDKLEVSDKVVSIKSTKTGFITGINTLKLGELARDLGAGRMNKEDKINHKVGILVTKKVGDYVTENEELVRVYLDEKDVAISGFVDAFEIGEQSKDKTPLIIDIID